MRKSFVTMGLVLAISATSTFTAFAGWEQTGATWKYQNTDKTYLTNSWNWIDGNGDGIAECYYFNADGIMLASTTTPDNFTVNEQGAWTVNGVVQTQQAPKETQAQVQPTQPAPQATEAYVEPQPEPQPEQNNTSSGGIDTSGWDLGGGVTVETPPALSEDQRLSPEEYQEINEINFN